MQVENWDDLRFVLALHRAGTLTTAAKQLNVDQTTVSRRLRALQTKLGFEIFEQLRGGVRFTVAGGALLTAAQRLEETLLDLDLKLTGEVHDIYGPIRITLPAIMAAAWMPMFLAFAQRHPQLKLELNAEDEVRNISRREADIAVRLTDAPPDHLVGKRIGDSAVAVFGVQACLDAHPDPAQRPWLSWDLGMESMKTVERFRLRHNPDAPVLMRCNTFLTILEGLRQGAGVSLLPCGCEHLVPGLLRLSEPEVIAPLWVLTHPELQRSPKIRAALEALYAYLAARAEQLAGAQR